MAKYIIWILYCILATFFYLGLGVCLKSDFPQNEIGDNLFNTYPIFFLLSLILSITANYTKNKKVFWGAIITNIVAIIASGVYCFVAANDFYAVYMATPQCGHGICKEFVTEHYLFSVFWRPLYRLPLLLIIIDILRWNNCFSRLHCYLFKKNELQEEK